MTAAAHPSVPKLVPSMAKVPLVAVLLLAGLLGGCVSGDPIRNLANQNGNAGPPANFAGDTTPPTPNGTRISLGQPVWSSPLPAPGPIQVGRR